MANLDLLSSENRVATPSITVTIGDYTFGVLTPLHQNYTKATVPNYIKSLKISKISGKVNNYTLVFAYPVKAGTDPNFFEKVLSKASRSRKMTITYGDLSTPMFACQKEEVIIKHSKCDPDLKNSKLVYTITGVSNAFKGTIGSYTFRERYEKPSTVIYEILYDNSLGLLDLFPGMSDRSLVEFNGLIPTDDAKVIIEPKTNVSVLDYLNHLVSCMRPINSNGNTLKQGSIYMLSIQDGVTQTINKDEKVVFEGSYFKIVRNDLEADPIDTYEVNVGFSDKSPVINCSITNDDSYSLLYDFQEELSQESYTKRINDDGEMEMEFTPVIASNNHEYKATEEEKNWWTKVTQYPITLSLTLRGLLRPAILMSYVRVNFLFYGRKFMASGLYIILAQEDYISESGYTTNLALLRVKGDNSIQ